MLVEATPGQAQLILGAMRNVATAQGAEPLGDADHAVLAAAHHYLFGATDDLDPTSLPDTIPVVLGAALEDPKLADHAGQLLTVMAVVDGTVDAAELAVVEPYAAVLGLTADSLRELAELGAQHLQYVIADAQRRNGPAASAGGGEADEGIRPYTDGRDDAQLAARYRALGDLDVGTHGRAFSDFYTAHGFAFPGEPRALAELFATRHDSTHVLSGYDASPEGEVLVAAFTAGMRAHEPMSVHLLPVVISWHLGPHVTSRAGSSREALDPEKLLVAWERGGEVTTDVFDPAWDFWAASTRPLDQLRAEYRVPPLEAKDAASGDFPDWYHPVA